MSKNWKDNQEHLWDLFERMSELKGNRPFKNPSEWKDHCKIVSEMLSNKYGEIITSNQVEMQTLIPTQKTTTKFSKSTARNLAIGILTGYITVEELNKHFFGK